MAEILVGRFSRLFQRLTGSKGDAPLRFTPSELQAVIALENDRPEHKYLAGERLMMGWGSVAAGGAGNRSQVMLANPFGSGVLCILEAIIVQDNVDVTLRTALSGTGFTLQNTAIPRDQRFPNITGAVQLIAKNNSALVAGQIIGTFNSSRAAQPLQLPMIFPPNFSGGTNGRICVDPSADNIPLTVTFLWRERAIEEGET